MARTTLNSDGDALDRARRHFGTESPSEAVNAALRDVLRRAELEGFTASEEIETDLDIDQLRGWRDAGARPLAARRGPGGRHRRLDLGA